MTRKRRRLYLLLSGMAVLALAVGLVLSAFQDSLVFFVSPSDLKAGKAPENRSLRLGGLVEPGSVTRLPDGLSVSFRITDTAESVAVSYKGILPDLFREGQGVVVEGRMNGSGAFIADEVLAKHDETYMPREVIDALKESGEWRGDGQARQP